MIHSLTIKMRKGETMVCSRTPLKQKASTTIESSNIENNPS